MRSIRTACYLGRKSINGIDDFRSQLPTRVNLSKTCVEMVWKMDAYFFDCSLKSSNRLVFNRIKPSQIFVSVSLQVGLYCFKLKQSDWHRLRLSLVMCIAEVAILFIKNKIIETCEQFKTKDVLNPTKECLRLRWNRSLSISYILSKDSLSAWY